MANKTNKLKVTQVASPIGRNKKQRAILIGLGLNKIDRQKTLEDTASIRGMVTKVSHLVVMQECK
ncbi:50S ribosomal protein L30 [Candidatus Arcanobacter lacustris]|jgi:large subunit ribosomal protein L30|uniref:Large ribosomal subunit protein uL30 n=1 Tax=Candidatus Arcanibacter lacustris TaxID=1607817 RepID=A0A0F5MP16_9RICK|nr:50S ribosomal protein L30 [Candidatus Arcanobacter lacustris]